MHRQIELLAFNIVRVCTAILYCARPKKIGLQLTVELFYLLKVFNILQWCKCITFLLVWEHKSKDIVWFYWFPNIFFN